MPVFIFHGADDPVTPAVLAEENYQALKAPQKDFVLLPGGDHFAVWSSRDKFLQELTAHIRPLAKK